MIDKLIEADEYLLNMFKTSLEEEGNNLARSRFYLIIDCKKVGNVIESNEKRFFEYSIKWLIRKNYFNDNLNEVKFSVAYESRMKNEFKVILRGIILA